MIWPEPFTQRCPDCEQCSARRITRFADFGKDVAFLGVGRARRRSSSPAERLASERIVRRLRARSGGKVPVRRVLPHPGPLPLGEGERQPVASTTEVPRLSQEPTKPLPLPAGEGWGEGEATEKRTVVESSANASHFLCLPSQRHCRPRPRQTVTTLFSEFPAPTDVSRRSPSPRPSPAGRGRTAFSLSINRGASTFPGADEAAPSPSGRGLG